MYDDNDCYGDGDGGATNRKRAAQTKPEIPLLFCRMIYENITNELLSMIELLFVPSNTIRSISISLSKRIAILFTINK